MFGFEEKIYGKKVPPVKNSLLVADVGGTHCTFGLFSFPGQKIKLLLTLRYDSQKIKDFVPVVKQVLDHLKEKYKIKAGRCCLAGAGPLSGKNDFLDLTNLKWKIDKKKLLRKTSLKSIKLINDFEAIAYGIEALPAGRVRRVKAGKAVEKGTKAVIGAGTGLGKGLLIWNDDSKNYHFLSSEGGHADLTAYTDEEIKILRVIKKSSGPAQWEDVLSGRGMSALYQYLGGKDYYPLTKYFLEIKKANFDPALITKYYNQDWHCRQTVDFFLRFYGRCAKNFALDALPLGGVYLAGGIAINNPALFRRKIFKDEFIKNKTHQDLLNQIPVLVIADYKVSLYGAAIIALGDVR